jgi:hypothetical protein
MHTYRVYKLCFVDGDPSNRTFGGILPRFLEVGKVAATTPKAAIKEARDLSACFLCLSSNIAVQEFYAFPQ